MAAEELRVRIGETAAWASDAARGKMFGVLVCRDAAGRMGYLAAYSGLLAGRNDWPLFVPPVFDAQQPDGHFKQTERYISSLNERLKVLEGEHQMNEEGRCEQQVNEEVHREPQLVEEKLRESEQQIEALRSERKRLSEELQLWLFRQYRMLNARGEEKDLVDIWRDYHSRPSVQQRYPLPPGGSGDCCAPKLLQYAYHNGLTPLCMAEFWLGQSPKGEVRHEGHYYPACRGKCLPILTWMLQGMDVDPDPQQQEGPPASSLLTLYDDPQLVVVVKPAVMLSVPGRTGRCSVEDILRARYPEAAGPMMVHRLDMDTSGLLVVAKTDEAYHALQQQFLRRSTRKRYVALVAPPRPIPQQGVIDLPLRPDPLDRPRQLADWLHGRPAITHYEVLSSSPSAVRLSLSPLTGRTHQLRVHCAHPEGLGMPIVGDALYGTAASRLCLHAERLTFVHPATGEEMTFHSAPDF